MLKPADQPGPVPGPGDERPVGELVHQLIEDGKAYARAELGVVKATAAAKAEAARLPAILFGAAFLLIQAAVTVLAVSVCMWLMPVTGPLVAGLIAFLLFAGAAAGLGWLGAKKLKEGL